MSTEEYIEALTGMPKDVIADNFEALLVLALAIEDGFEVVDSIPTREVIHGDND